jgi:hypothetical protein
MKQTVYPETTIPSYLTAWRSNELIMAANQQAAREWWDLSKPNFEVFISEVVIKEAAEGTTEAAERRLASIRGIFQN